MVFFHKQNSSLNILNFHYLLVLIVLIDPIDPIDQIDLIDLIGLDLIGLIDLIDQIDLDLIDLIVLIDFLVGYQCIYMQSFLVNFVLVVLELLLDTDFDIYYLLLEFDIYYLFLEQLDICYLQLFCILDHSQLLIVGQMFHQNLCRMELDMKLYFLFQICLLFSYYHLLQFQKIQNLGKSYHHLFG